MDVPEEVGRADLVARIAAMSPGLRPAERRVAEAVIADPAMVARESISALAERCGVSAPTVVRFAKRVGFSGYPQLRVGLAMAVGAEEGRSGRPMIAGMVSEDDTLVEVAAKVASANARSVEDTLASLDMAALEVAVSALTEARTIDVIGIGSSSLTGEDLVQKLTRFGAHAWAHGDRHAAITTLALRGEGDVVVAFSHSGTTGDVLEPLRLAVANGVTIIGVSGNPLSPMGGLADALLVYRSREPAYRLGAMASRIAQLTVVDCLLAGMAIRRPDPIRAALDATFKAVSDL